jgi:hypothetical protein
MLHLTRIPCILSDNQQHACTDRTILLLHIQIETQNVLNNETTIYYLVAKLCVSRNI